MDWLLYDNGLHHERVNIDQINEAVKELCHKSNFAFIDHQNITSNDLWVDGTHLTNSGKAILAGDFAEKIKKIFVRILVFRVVLSSRFYKSHR